MQVTQDVKKEILKFIEKKIDTDEMWAEAFSKFITLDEPDQNGAVWDMLEGINDSMRWDESFARSQELLAEMGERALKDYKEGKTISLEEFLELTDEELLTRFPGDDARFHDWDPNFLKHSENLILLHGAKSSELISYSKDNPRHGSLQFRRVRGTRNHYSARVDDYYRVLGVVEGNVITWYWVGPHDEYDRMIP